jgi:hypothetical protein
MTVLFICIGVVLSAIGGIFVLKVFISLPGQNTGIDQQSATYLALVFNAALIMFLGTVYKALAKLLNDWENYRTDTKYEDSLIAKTFTFCFVNSFATLFYLAFVKSGMDILGQRQVCNPDAESARDNQGNLAADACFGNLGTALLIVFLVQMIVNNSIEILLPMIMGQINLFLNTREKKKSKETEIVKPDGEVIVKIRR